MLQYLLIYYIYLYTLAPHYVHVLQKCTPGSPRHSPSISLHSSSHNDIHKAWFFCNVAPRLNIIGWDVDLKQFVLSKVLVLCSGVVHFSRVALIFVLGPPLLYVFRSSSSDGCRFANNPVQLFLANWRPHQLWRNF